MAHIDEGMLQAYLDEEVAGAEIDSHLAQCTACVAELDRLRSASQLFASALRAQDVMAPTLRAHVAVKRAHAREPRRRAILPRVPLARAAMLLLGLAAVASATIPGSPVRAWIADALRAVTGTEQRRDIVQPPVAAPPAPLSGEQAGAAAVSVGPADGRVSIHISGASPAAVVKVELVDAARASVRVAGAASSARFRTGPGRIEVLGVGNSDVAVEIPRSAADARVEVDGRVIFPTNR